MHDISATIDAIYIGSQKTIGPKNAPTGIFKDPVESAYLTTQGLRGDVQADRRVHGGPEKALYHYPADNYSVLKQALPTIGDSFIPGSIGENLSSKDIDDSQIHIGDILKIGETLVQVSQPRRPCWKVNYKYGDSNVASLLMSQEICGWYYRVIEEGSIKIGDKFQLQERLDKSVSVAGLCHAYMENMRTFKLPDGFNRKIPGLSTEWRFG